MPLAPTIIGPTTSSTAPTVSRTGTSAPVATSAETGMVPSPFITTSVQWPSSGSQVIDCGPRPLAELAQNAASVGGTSGEPPSTNVSVGDRGHHSMPTPSIRRIAAATAATTRPALQGRRGAT